MKKVSQLEWEDKFIHRRMKEARFALNKLSKYLRKCKPDSVQWGRCAGQAQGAANILKDWQEAIRRGEK